MIINLSILISFVYNMIFKVIEAHLGPQWTSKFSYKAFSTFVKFGLAIYIVHMHHLVDGISNSNLFELLLYFTNYNLHNTKYNFLINYTSEKCFMFKKLVLFRIILNKAMCTWGFAQWIDWWLVATICVIVYEEEWKWVT